MQNDNEREMERMLSGEVPDSASGQMPATEPEPGVSGTPGQVPAPAAGMPEQTSAPAVVPEPERTPAPTVAPDLAATSTPAPAAPKKKKTCTITPLLIVIVIALAAMIAVGILAYNFGKQEGSASCKKSTPSSNTGGDSDDKTDGEGGDTDDDLDGGSGDDEGAAEAEALKKRNERREDDLARVLVAVNQYQANNNGKVPFGYGGTRLATFVYRYIDQQCAAAKWSGDTFTDGCSDEFKDPQGEIYKMEDKGSAKDFNYVNGEYDVTKSGVKNEKTFYGFTYATCGNEGMIAKGTGDRDVAVFMVLEGGTVLCNDNH